MRIVRYHEKGPPEVLKIEDAPTPQPAQGEVLVRIEATSVGYADVLRRAGGHHPGPPISLPYSPGVHAVGLVESVGPGVDGGLVGRRVMGSITTGGYAEQGLAKAADLQDIPDGVDPVLALTMFSEADTAGLAIRAAGKMQPGETVFVPAATGGVGLVAIQLCRLWGASRVFGAASSPEKRKIVESLGAIPIDYTKDDWSKEVLEKNDGQGVDLAFEVTGGPVFYETFNAVRPGGRVVNYGNVTDTDSPINPRQLLRKNQALIGFFRSQAARDGLYVQERKAVMDEVARLLREGKLQAPIGGAFTLEEAPQAHRVLETRSALGKVVVTPNGRLAR